MAENVDPIRLKTRAGSHPTPVSASTVEKNTALLRSVSTSIPMSSMVGAWVDGSKVHEITAMIRSSMLSPSVLAAVEGSMLSAVGGMRSLAVANLLGPAIAHTRWAAGLSQRWTPMLRVAQPLFPDTRFAAQLAGLFPTIKLLDTVHTQMLPFTSTLQTILKEWMSAAWFGAGVIREAGEWAYRAAMRTRKAILTSLDERPVEEFIKTVLGRRPTRDLVDATKMVLLGDDWQDLADADPQTLVKHLKHRVRHEHSLCKPIWERELRYAPVRMLGEEITVAGVGVATLGDLVPDPHTPEDLLLAREFNDPGAQFILDRLSPTHRRVLTGVADGMTWRQAAAAEGLPDAVGQQARRRLGYVRKDFESRQAQRQNAGQR